MFGEYFLLSAFSLIFALTNQPKKSQLIMKALFINGSPRKNGNTAKLLFQQDLNKAYELGKRLCEEV